MIWHSVQQRTGEIGSSRLSLGHSSRLSLGHSVSQKVAKLPWAGPSSRFTALFERLAIDWLTAAARVRKRRKESLDGLFKSVTGEQRASIRAVAMGMWDPYASSVKEHVEIPSDLPQSQMTQRPWLTPIYDVPRKAHNFPCPDGQVPCGSQCQSPMSWWRPRFGKRGEPSVEIRASSDKYNAPRATIRLPRLR